MFVSTRGNKNRYNTTMNIKERVTIITGAGRGIGQATARLFARGNHVMQAKTTRREKSARSYASVKSIRSFVSILSLFSAGGLLSIGSAGSILSIGSCGSILSIGSVGSILCIGSAGGILGIGNKRMFTIKSEQ